MRLMAQRASPGATLLCVGILALACSPTRGENVDPSNNGSQYAWGENLGWLNFEPGGSGGLGARVTDSGLTGWAWSENAGWISLSCRNRSCAAGSYGVTNDGTGHLAGHAWSENSGWIHFAPPGAGVEVDRCTGILGGRAWAENGGWITFSSTGPVAYRVATSWSRVGASGLRASKAGGTSVQLSWTAVAGAGPFDVVRGRLSVLRNSGGSFASATEQCIADNSEGTALTTGGDPNAGEGFWFLVRGSTCGGAGTYDDGTQSGSSDAGISGSGHGCP